MLLNALTRLVLRAIAWMVASAGLVAHEAAQWIVDDHDLALVVNAILGFLGVEIALYISHVGLFMSKKRAARLRKKLDDAKKEADDG